MGSSQIWVRLFGRDLAADARFDILKTQLRMQLEKYGTELSP